MTNSRARKDLMLVGVKESLTIATGVITISRKTSHIEIDTEASASTDDLDTINGGIEGDIIIIYSADSARDPTLTENGNIILSGSSFAMTTSDFTIVLLYKNSKWTQIALSVNS